LGGEVRAAQKRPRTGNRDFTSAPLQVLNGFSAKANDSQQSLTAEMLRGLFPAIDVRSFNPAECRRVVLFHKDGEKDTVHFRHFSVGKRSIGMQRGVSRLLKTSRIPRLGNREDIADFVMGGGGGASESEMEDAEEIPNLDGHRGKTGVRLTEIGPRVEMLLVKVEAEVCCGTVLYHRYQTKTATEQEVLEQKARLRKKLKERNDYLVNKAEGSKATRKKREEQKKERAAKAADAEADYNAENPGDSDDNAVPTKKTRYHPFGWGKKAKSGEQETSATVEINPRSKTGNRGGAKRREERQQAKASQKGRGKGSQGKGSIAAKVKARFQKSAKQPKR
jgi:ribosome biogenesis protein SSF1/2